MHQYTRRRRAGECKWAAVAAILLACAAGTAAEATAATIALHQDAVSLAVAQRLFTSNGKRVLSGNLASCNYVYLEQPVVTFRDRRLFLRVHLAGRVGMKASGNCVGAGDAFYTTVSGQPVIAGETVALNDFRMDEGRPEYRKLLEPFLRQQIPSLLGLNLREELAKGLQNSGSAFKLALTGFQLLDVAAGEGMLTIRFDFALQATKP